MTVYVNNITINKGEYFSRDFYLDNSDGTPLNLVGYGASAYIRKHPESLNTTAKFNVGFIDRDNGRIRVSLASSITSEIKPGRYVYDVLFTDSNDKKSIVIEGGILATEDISEKRVITAYENAIVGVIEETSSSPFGVSTPRPSPLITINDIVRYGVVHMGVNFIQCSKFAANDSATRILLENPTARDQLLTYIRSGGVLWLNAEWWNGNASGDGCSNKTNINAMLTLLETEIRASSDIPTIGSTRSTETSVINSGFPTTQNQAASVVFTGGTPVYVDGANIITTYEKIDNGILYVSGDSNTFSGPSYSQTYYNALRNLVIYG